MMATHPVSIQRCEIIRVANDSSRLTIEDLLEARYVGLRDAAILNATDDLAPPPTPDRVDVAAAVAEENGRRCDTTSR
eukprot:CAMPEP_0198350258 /NCGR_PEP_ID=MMETSP1450-20131203/98061_1 /TAXON_ID=753684 ORGANISM="Madagascaria erythrocladiodes, Strain CCMP3234" /NCGR_SAMPLE_ID=MMETSP1450 /ASSEMBLY_ACC=CAM_ASM_001115 /LENGTH=77 /DNA_ID=CAMNT_0044056041 /DNA_START=8 /DNA_END=239 /DNA_ORIENTATION=+